MGSIKLYFETMAGTHLGDALRALRDTGSADALYDHKLRSMDPKELDWPDVSAAQNKDLTLAVAEGAAMLNGEAPEASVLSYVLAQRKAILRYGKRPLPDIPDEPAPTNLLSEARRKAWN